MVHCTADSFINKSSLQYCNRTNRNLEMRKDPMKTIIETFLITVVFFTVTLIMALGVMLIAETAMESSNL